VGGSKNGVEPHILPRLMPDMRIYNFQNGPKWALWPQFLNFRGPIYVGNIALCGVQNIATERPVIQPNGTIQLEKTVKNKSNGPKYTLFGPVEVSNDLNRVLHGISLYCMVLYFIQLYGIAWYFIVLHGISLYCMV